MSEHKGSKLLINEPPLQVLPSLAVRIGLNESIFLQQLHYHLNNKNFGKVVDDRKWIYKTMEEWCEDFPFWSVNTIRRTIEKLVEAKLVLEGNYNEKLSRTKWYTIDYDKLDECAIKKPKKKRTDYPNFGDTMKNKRRTSKVETIEHPNLGDTIIQTLDIDSSKTPSKTPLSKPADAVSTARDPFAEELDGPIENPGLQKYLEIKAAQNLATPSQTVVESQPINQTPKEESFAKEEKVAAPPQRAALFAPRGRAIAFCQDGTAHLFQVGTKHPKTCIKCRVHLGTWAEKPFGGLVYTPCSEWGTNAGVPTVDRILKDAIAQHLQGIKPDEATSKTGVFAQKAAGVWRKRLKTDKLTAEHYAAIARSIPVFVQWFLSSDGCGPDCHLPNGNPNNFEDWYTKFPSDWTPDSLPRSANGEPLWVSDPERPGIMISPAAARAKLERMEEQRGHR